MRRRLLPRPLLSLSVFLIWALITNAASLALLVLGGLLAIVVPHLAAPFWPEPPHLVRPLSALRFLAVFAVDIVTANWRVARQVIGPLHRLSPAFVEVPLDLRDPFVATLLASVVSLTPGTVAIDVDRQGWILLVHALDAPDPQALIDEIKERYEQPLREIFAC
ncbi:MAG TPA: Na+/H+ antiporter subunit E [Candidatus Accumulibacter phosphatis]|nr:MAG: Mrp complex subunit E1 [Candidatus Accumulibacter sp. SK-11]HAY29656.1 Na+/H+ antiporter subunit E [Accumulibacter sp.]HRL75439.1 Na+/H+ antiporter subunit E [Candidatus Accumulibacter phosphatis]HCV12565.1 Na+/H+ antiporter subunit E [Accumulibacter sp.]HRQ93997.1 Na+/H+ antiporter subunit E [Candidatus Accumulibacter phosphatis]